MPVAIVGFIGTLVPGLVGAGGALTLAGNLVAGALGLGLSYAGSVLFADKPSTLKPQDVKTALRQSVLTRRKHYGLVRTSGGYAFYRSRKGNLYMVMYLGEGPTNAFVEHYLDQRPVTLDANGYIQGKPYRGKVRIETRKGQASETHYSSIASVFPEIWGANHRGNGCISVAITARGVKPEDFNSVYPNRIPQYDSVRQDGIVYDPRTSTSVWSPNLYLIYLDYLRNPDGAGIAWDYFDEDDFSAAADVGDQILPTNGGGTVRRAHGQLSYDLTTEPADIIDRLETATDGRIYLKSNGKIGIHPGIWVDPTVSIHDGCITSYEMSDSSGPLREANEITLEYTNPLSGFSSASCDPWRDETDISASGTRTIPIEAFEIQNHHHGRRVQKLRYHRASARWQGKVVTDLYGIQARGERRIFLEIRDLGIDFEPFEIESFEEDDESMTVVMSVRSCRSDMYELSSEEEGTPPPTPPSTDEDDLDAPTNVVATSSQRVVSGQGSVSVITVTWDAYPDRDDLTAEAQISLADQNQWSPMTMDASQTRAEAIGLADGAIYDVQVRWKGAYRSDWVLKENIKAVADAIAPQSLESFTITAAAPHLGHVKFLIATKNDPRVKTVNLYRVASGAAFNINTATPIYTQVAGPSTSYTYTDGDPTRSNIFSNPGFDTDTVWTKGTGWTIGSGTANKAAGNNTLITQAASIAAGKKGRLSFDITAFSAGSCVPRVTNGTNNYEGAARSAVGAYRDTIAAVVATTTAGIRGSATFVGSIDNLVLYEETSDCAPQGVWDYYAVPFNGSNIPGPASGPLTTIII